MHNDSIYVTRLQKLYDFVEPMKHTQINMRSWHTGDFEEFIEKVRNAPIVQDCGTAACLAGWACSMREFNNEGLVWDNSFSSSQGIPTYDGYESNKALSKFFGLSYEDACYIFTWRPLTKYEVMHRLKDMITKMRRNGR